MHSIIETHRDEIHRLCRQFSVQSLDLFGSAIGDGFDPQRSDIDFVVDFLPHFIIRLSSVPEHR